MPIYDRQIHIVSFDVPFPPSYGGVIDVYYKIKALHEMGIKVHLHCYKYGRDEAPELNSICASVNYYKRERFSNPYIGTKPYIVRTRNTRRLLSNLMLDNHPILFEGLHSCYHLVNPALEHRFKMVRMHNIEHDYYTNLANVERNPAKKYFFKLESRRLSNFEFTLKHANCILAISPNDKKYLETKFENVVYVPAFHPNTKVETKTGKGDFILYHGNLEVGENDQAALYLVNEVFSRMSLPCVIAGNNPSTLLKQVVKKYPNISLVESTSIESVHALIREAQVNVLPTFQATGIKLKLINALFIGRHCVVNTAMICNTGLKALCIEANDPQTMAAEIACVFEKEFTEADIEKRKHFFDTHFNNHESAKQVIAILNRRDSHNNYRDQDKD
jgi:hypothetical protein